MFKIILGHNNDKSFTIGIEDCNTGNVFNLKVVTPSYPNHDVYKYAYDYAYSLSGFMGIDFVEYK
jgi:hypothetical protein